MIRDPDYPFYMKSEALMVLSCQKLERERDLKLFQLLLSTHRGENLYKTINIGELFQEVGNYSNYFTVIIHVGQGLK
jgi:hypothetical protein